jgi:hypothetical protein
MYIFPGSVCLFSCSQIGRPILGIYRPQIHEILGIEAAQFHFWEYINHIFETVQASLMSPDASLELETDVDPGFGDRVAPSAWPAKLTAKIQFLQMFPPVFARREVCKNFNRRKCQMFANSTYTDLCSSQFFATE